MSVLVRAGFLGGISPPLKMVLPPLINEKALKCKPSALIFGRGRAKELLHVRDDLRKRTR